MRALWFSFLAALSACSWPRPKADPTQFFVLEPRSSAQAPARARPKARLEAVEVPTYLMNPRLAARSAGNRIDYAEFRRWAEPLPDGIARVLREGLAPEAEVEPFSAGAERSEGRLRVRVRSFEGLRAPSGAASILVQATWEWRPAGGGPSVRGRFSAPPASWDGRDYGRLAELLSDALAGLCAEIAQKVWPRNSVWEKRPPEASEEPTKSGPRGVPTPTKPVPAQ